jgi:hypothetical protein
VGFGFEGTPGRAYLQEAVLAAEELVLLHDGFGGQGEFVFTESRLILTWEYCLRIKRKQHYERGLREEGGNIR